MGMSSIYLEPVALRTVQLVNVEVLALTRARQVWAYRRSLQVVWTGVLAFRDEYPSSVTMYAVYVIATPLKGSRGSEYPGEDHGASQLPKSTCHYVHNCQLPRSGQGAFAEQQMKAVSIESGLSKKEIHRS